MSKRKAYRPREVHVPMTTGTRDALSLELRLAVEALIGAPSQDAYNSLSKMMAAIQYSGGQCSGLDIATATLTSICDRYERVGKVGVSEHEAQQLRKATGSLEEVLGRMPMNKFRSSVAVVAITAEEMGI